MRRLDELYSQIPTFKCIEGCTDCCGPVPFNKEEINRLGKKPGFDPSNLKCKFSYNGGCDIYENRPMVCRIFGTVPSEPMLTCPHACGPLFPLGSVQEHEIMNEYQNTFPDFEGVPYGKEPTHRKHEDGREDAKNPVDSD